MNQKRFFVRVNTDAGGEIIELRDRDAADGETLIAEFYIHFSGARREAENLAWKLNHYPLPSDDVPKPTLERRIETLERNELRVEMNELVALTHTLRSRIEQLERPRRAIPHPGRRHKS